MMGSINIFKSHVTAADAVSLVATLSGSSDVQVEMNQYFPYFCFVGSCTLPSLFGKRQTEIRCLVDAVNGHGATADRFDIDHEYPAQTNVIAAKLTREEATAAARRAITHSLGRNLRVIARFEPKFGAANLVYKKFWVVGNGQIRALVDSTDGSMHPLRANAA